MTEGTPTRVSLIPPCPHQCILHTGARQILCEYVRPSHPSSAQNLPLGPISCRAKASSSRWPTGHSAITPFLFRHYLLPCPPCSFGSSHLFPLCSLSTPGLVLPQDLCTGCSLCLELLPPITPFNPNRTSSGKLPSLSIKSLLYSLISPPTFLPHTCALTLLLPH